MKILRSSTHSISYILEFLKMHIMTTLYVANMGGVEGSLDDGLTKFKSNFAPHIEEFIGEFNIPVNKVLYRVSNFVYELRKNSETNISQNHP